MKTYKNFIITITLLILFGIVGHASAEYYVDGPGITTPDINSHDTDDIVFAGAAYTLTCAPSTDLDYWCYRWKNYGYYDNVVHTWSGPGTFNPQTGTTVTWTAPSTTGNATITLTADDTGTPDYYDSPSTSNSITLIVEDGIYYVDADATGSNDGSSWTDAFTNIETAVDALCDSGTSFLEAWVAEGTYTLSSQLVVDEVVAIYGGFDGTETSRSQRNWDANVVTISGNDTVRCFNVTKNATIDGFTIQNGRAGDGGGMYLTSSADPCIINCAFTNNEATDEGGGLCIGTGSYPYIINCTFTNNEAADNGGGLFNQNGGFTLTDCDFTGNSAGDYGGAIYNYNNNEPILTNCQFNQNSAGIDGAGIYNSNGELTLTACAFTGNSSGDNGGAIYYYDGDNSTMTNCLFYQNSAVDDGGGICGYVTSGLTLTNSTFYANTAGENGGGMKNSSGSTITNSIFWGNSDVGGTDESAQIYGGASSSINYSCIQGGWTGTYEGTGNISDDPCFVDTYELGSLSECIDMGDNTAISEANDLAGNTRKIDDPNMFDGGNGTAPIVDMGAYERTSASTLPGISQLAGGFRYSLALRSDGTVCGSGYNSSGRLGNDSAAATDVLVQTHDGEKTTIRGNLQGIQQIDASQSHSMAVDVNGFVWGWGSGYLGRLGDDSTGGSYTPVQAHDGEMSTDSGFLENIVKVSAGYEHTATLDDVNNDVWTFGGNYWGQLGNDKDMSSYTMGNEYEKEPVHVLNGDMNTTSGYLEDINDISAGHKFTLACANDGSAWAWGDNGYGELGDDTTNHRTEPIQVLSGEQDPNDTVPLTNIIDVEANFNFRPASYALDSNGNVWAWGSGEDGQLGNGNDGSQYKEYTPVKVHDYQTPYADGLDEIVAIAAGENHCLALDENGYVYAWGNGIYGQLGNDQYYDSDIPVRVEDNAGTGYLSNIVSIHAGANHSLAVDSSGNVWGWGSNLSDGLGLGSGANDYYDLPQLIE